MLARYKVRQSNISVHSGFSIFYLAKDFEDPLMSECLLRERNFYKINQIYQLKFPASAEYLRGLGFYELNYENISSYFVLCLSMFESLFRVIIKWWG